MTKLEIEFPPLLGGDQSKSQFDDFDNIQELDKNKDWTMLLAPLFLGETIYQNGKTWLIFPDLKECELAKEEWAGQRYREATFTTIEAVTNYYLATAGSSESNNSAATGYDAPWGSNLMSNLSKLVGGGNGQDAGLLGNMAALDPIVEGNNSPATLWLVIQPGNGGPVEDWVNVEKMSNAQPNTRVVVINGALDKVRSGFYPAIFFPKLAQTVDRFYNKFESVFYIKPFADKVSHDKMVCDLCSSFFQSFLLVFSESSSFMFPRVCMVGYIEFIPSRGKLFGRTSSQGKMAIQLLITSQ